MTDPIGTAQERELIERLTREEAPNPETRMYGRHTRVPVNPDGIEAADALQSRIAEVGRLTESLNELRSLAMDDHWGVPKVCWEIVQRIDAALSLQRRV